jgi:hypothetical protein
MKAEKMLSSQALLIMTISEYQHRSKQILLLLKSQSQVAAKLEEGSSLLLDWEATSQLEHLCCLVQLVPFLLLFLLSTHL